MTQPHITIPAVTAAGGRHEKGGPYRFRHGWIPINGQGVDRRGDDSAASSRTAGSALAGARSEARQRLDTALDRLAKEHPEGARRQRAQLNELREAGKLTPERMRIATDAANRAAVPSGHHRATRPDEGLGADRFGPGKGKNYDHGNGGHGGAGVDAKPSGSAPARAPHSAAAGDNSVRGNSKAAKDARVTLDNLKGTTGDNTAGVLKKLTDPQLRNLHEAIRAEHADTSIPHVKATLKRLSDAVRVEHSSRKAAVRASAVPVQPRITVP